MSMVNKLKEKLTGWPIDLYMTLDDGGIKMGLARDRQLLSHSQLTQRGTLQKLPSALANYLVSVTPHPNGYLLPLPHAREMYLALRKQASENVRIHCQSLENLHVIKRPSDFEIRWIYDPRAGYAIRQLVQAEHYLGMGWFQRENSIWLLDEEIPEAVIGWLDLSTLTGPQIYSFVEHVLPRAQGDMEWPFSSNVHIEHDVTFRVEILKLNKRSIDIQINSNRPKLIQKLTRIPEDPDNAISELTIIPDIGTQLTPTLLAVAHSGGSKRIEGDDLPAFVQDEIRPNAGVLNIDLDEIDSRYMIIDAAEMELVWKLQHEKKLGIGSYRATPCVKHSKLGTIPISTLMKKVEAKIRFHRVQDSWIEFTPDFLQKTQLWRNKTFTSYTLSSRQVIEAAPSEVHSQIALSGAKSFELTSAVETAASFLNTMREHGIPAGILGLQLGTKDAIAIVCRALLRDYPNASILWIVPQKKKAAVISSLKERAISFIDGNRPWQGSLKGIVFVANPEVRVGPRVDWTLTIFQEADVLASGSNLVAMYSQVRRHWSIATFTRTDWNSGSRSAQIGRILQLYPTDMPLFGQRYVRAFPDQREGFLAILASPFKGVFSPSSVPSPKGSYPIPPRPQASLPVSLAPTELRDRLSVTITVASSRDDFVKQALHFVDRTEAHADPVPFMQYWPTYAEMMPLQQKWYFYWRTQLRCGNFLRSDTSYLFVHIYEALNLVGFDSPQAAFDHLKGFWRYYRILQPKLDRYLVDWIADLTIVHQLQQSPLDWYAEALSDGAILSDDDLAIEAWLHSHRSLEHIPIELLFRLARYSPNKNKFYTEHNQNSILDSAFKRGLHGVDEHLKKHGQRLLDLGRSQTPRTIRRRAFASALHSMTEREIEIASVYSRAQSEQLADGLTSILKYTENIWRRSTGFSSQLRGFSISPEWASVLDETAAPIRERRDIAINMDAVEALRQETSEVQRMLTVEEASDAPFENIPSATREERPLVDIDRATADKLQQEADLLLHRLIVPNTVLPANSSLLTNLYEIRNIMGVRGSPSWNIIELLYASAWSASQAQIADRLASDLISIEIKQINEMALNLLGDNLLFNEEDKWIVAEDYRDEVEHLLEQEEEIETETDTITSEATSDKFSALNDEWAGFAKQMKSHHWEGLAALASQMDVNTRLDAIARSTYITTNQLIDEINELALTNIGDIVIDTSAETPQIEAEDLEPLLLVMTWAKDNALLET